MKTLYSTLLCLLSIAFFAQSFASDKMGYWSVQRKGANFFNETPSSDWFVAANEVGIEFARLAPDKWKCEHRDFLLGDADEFTEISLKDYQTLKNILDQADCNDSGL